MSLKHLGPGSEMPPLKSATLRIYSMVFCPYAQRARLVLAAKKIPYEVVNVNLKTKPDWYLEVNPLGQVPCLQHDDGRALPESLIVCDYIDEIYPEHRLTPADPYTHASHRVFVEIFGKVITTYYKFLLNEKEDSANYLAALDTIEKKLETDFVGGDKPAMVDYMIWPWLERLSALKLMKNLELDAQRFPKLIAYVNRMLELPAVKEVLIPAEVHVNFYKGYVAGEQPDYDSGIDIKA